MCWHGDGREVFVKHRAMDFLWEAERNGINDKEIYEEVKEKLKV